jgi:hypothetical protein
MVRKARVDANQPVIVATLRRCGFAVAHTHTLGKGFPDLCISRRGWTGLVEVKDSSKPPSARKLTPDEASFHAKWPGEIFVIESVDDVLKLNERFINEAICKT